MERQDANPAAASAAEIAAGDCYALFAYDVGFNIDLDEALRRMKGDAERETVQQPRGGPGVLQFTPPPLRIPQAAPTLALGQFQTKGEVEALMYDFGAVSIAYRIPLSGGFDGLLDLSERLYGNPALREDSRRRVEALVHSAGPAIEKAHVPEFFEDYVIYQIERLGGPLTPSAITTSRGSLLAQILRSERRALSEQEIADALACRISYSPDDLTLIDWNAAIVFDREADDVRTVLEFANVELLELRLLDQKLDRALTEAYEAISRRAWHRRIRTRVEPGGLRRVSQLEVDNAILFEGVNNTLKLIGDQYLARVYRLASQRFHLSDWDASILRKLATLEGIYQKMSDERSHRRMEILEWIVIILIAGEIILSLVSRGH